MSSAHQTALRIPPEADFAGPPVTWDEPRTANLNQAIEAALRAKRIALCLEHRDLDLTISALIESATSDELLISRLKKRRLHLKDEISRIEGHLPA